MLNEVIYPSPTHGLGWQIPRVCQTIKYHASSNPPRVTKLIHISPLMIKLFLKYMMENFDVDFKCMEVF